MQVDEARDQCMIVQCYGLLGLITQSGFGYRQNSFDDSFVYCNRVLIQCDFKKLNGNNPFRFYYGVDF